MAAGHPLGPEFVPAAAPVCHLSDTQRGLKRLFVHIGEHQNFRCPVVLHDDRNQSVRVRLHLAPWNAALQNVHLQAPLCRFFFQSHKIRHFCGKINTGDPCCPFIGKHINDRIFCSGGADADHRQFSCIWTMGIRSGPQNQTSFLIQFSGELRLIRNGKTDLFPAKPL